MTIADELERRMWYLADPAVKWVRGTPVQSGESCLVYDGGRRMRQRLSDRAWAWLTTQRQDSGSPIRLNDLIARDRDDVLWMLQEAVDQARWEGV